MYMLMSYFGFYVLTYIYIYIVSPCDETNASLEGGIAHYGI